MKRIIIQPKERQHYKAPDIALKLELAYDQLAISRPGVFRELVKFDRQQSRRDEVYRKHTSSMPCNYDQAVSDKSIDNIELFTNKLLTDRDKLICDMMFEGYYQEEIAKQLGITQGRVSQIKASIADKLADESVSQAAMQSDSRAIYKLNVPKIIKEWQRIEQAEQSGSKAAIQPSEQVSQVGAQMSSNRDNETHIRGKETGVPQ